MILFEAEIIKKISSLPDPKNINISHREYSCQFSLSAYVESFIQIKHSYIILVVISYNKILI